MTHHATTTDLRHLIDELTRPTHENTREAGWRTIPSLWNRLLDSTTRAGGENSSVARSRPPVATAALSIVDDAERCCAAFLTARRRPLKRQQRTGGRDVPAELRAIAVDPRLTGEHLDEWIELVTRWIRQARICLEGTGPLGWLRSIACIDCGATNHTEWIGGEPIVTPALQLVWVRTDAGAEMLRHVHCTACGRDRWPADLHLIADRHRQDNQTKETMAS